MRYYVIMNGVNSLTIQGLAIRELPPISKPLMRNIREEIDGRNGDIITELGYSAYDKELEIGLYGNSYDINDIIAFFNGKGTITFSDEPDKYYYYQILNQIDYEKLLKFKTASVIFHCQPFKYKVDEVPLEEEYEYVEGEGTNITLNNTSNSIFNEFDLKGNTEQDGTPTPTDPIEVETTTGRQEVSIVGKNVFDTSKTPIYTNSVSTSTIGNGIRVQVGTAGGYRYAVYILGETSVLNGKTIRVNSLFSASSSNSPAYALIYCDENGGNRTNITQATTSGSTISATIGTTTNTHIALGLYANNTSTSQATGTYADFTNIMVVIDNEDMTYEAFKEQSYEINLGKNLFYINDCSLSQNGGVVSVSNGNTITITGTFSTGTNFSFDSYVDFSSANTQLGNAMTLSVQNIVNEGTASMTPNRFFIASANTFPYLQPDETTGYQTKTITEAFNRCRLYIPDGTYNTTFNIQLEKGNQPSTYSSYFTPIELCKIGDYQDYLYNENNNWYIHKVIGKVILDGSENWYRGTSANTRSVFSLQTFTDRLTTSRASEFYSSNFYYRGNAQGTDLGYAMSFGENPYTKFLYTQVPTDVVAPGEVATFKTWLGTHNTDVYYILDTPTNTLIENEELINQLNALMLATSQDGQTNIIQSTFNLPFIIKVSALKQNSDHLIINNIGNTFAKPTLDLEGTGIVDIYLNDVQVFQVDLSEVNEIVLNTAEMEAYNPNTHQLANRQVTGDYSNFKLDVGENDLRFSGNLTKATVTYYMRWL